MTHRFPARLILPALAIVLSACGETATPEKAILTSDDPQTTPAIIPAVTLPSTDVVGPAITQTIPPSAPMPGLVYTTLSQNKGMVGPWIVEADGRGKQLGNKPDPALSPDRSQLLYSQDGDIWLLDLLTGTEKNLTNTYDLVEEYCQWWPARPGLIVFHYRPRNDVQPAAGFLSTIKTDGSNYYILDGQIGANSPAALSPDGRSIAYDRDGQPWLFTYGAGRIPIFPGSFQEHFRIAVNPVWSPDSRQVAWQLYGLSGGADESGATAILSLDGMAVLLLHRYPITTGSGESNDHLAWSADGRWLAVANQTGLTEAGIASLWVMHPDGSEEYHLGTGDFPVWSPDGATLVYQTEDGVFAIKAGEWIPFPVTLPETARVIDWVTF